MSISEMLLKSNPAPAKREMSQSEYNKLVDANAKLMDKIKVLEKKYNIMKENAETLAKRINKAIEYIEQLPFNDLTPIEVKVIYKILQGVDKE